MATKNKCEICNFKRHLFEVQKAGQEIKACSKCITEQMLTGWSK
jgi:ribosome-binding protein aMBF1 (putative translation factor)